MGQRDTRTGAQSRRTEPRKAAALQRDGYPMLRITSENFLWNVDLVTRLQGSNLLTGLVFVTVWLAGELPRDGAAIGIREIARKLGQPPETVRRHAQALVRSGVCRVTPDGLVLGRTAGCRRICLAWQRGVMRITRRTVVGLKRARVAEAVLAKVRTGGPAADERALTAAATRGFLEGIRLVTELSGGDLLRGVVYTAVWTANVKHLTDAVHAGGAGVLPDDQRQPVSVWAISQSLRLPYETVRRHARALEQAGICRRVDRRGLIVPAAVHASLINSSAAACDIMMTSLRDFVRLGLTL